ncbi:hypothetical protein IE81DRAFT_289632 [Ceraceosorus guamensis]|uniref:ARM repeat-containing protein n=1 Tax=Ceraceosorus guamensis TaxID=1522189 RepID=A0A316W2J2_9BASI|nr:hypothetical protein IE81DRAFT_289632 [Ceraceosorus guamensis]PWN42791.1 hypothetical protein IE81DRAFT_289632 [Ceraceosorus guamensis]
MVRPQSTRALARLQNTGQIYQKGTSADALLKRLKALQKELSEMEQEQVDLSSLNPLCKQLIANPLVHHKVDAVKGSAACCLADLLRLYAPQAPYTGAELRDIFAFFIDRLTSPKGGLSNPSSPLYPDTFYLLESLSNVKSITLVADLHGADEMMTDLFRGFFELIKPETTKNVEICMADILVQLIDECLNVPQEVLEILIASFHSKAEKANPAAHQLAVEICDATKDRLQKHVAQYFSEILVSVSEEDDVQDKEKSLRNAHLLVAQINRAVPALLLNVIPALEQELRTDDTTARSIAIKTLGQMFAETTAKTGGGGDLARKYASTWREWLARANDKHPTLRIAWTEAAGPLFANHPELRVDLRVAAQNKLADPDERVRASMVKVLGSTDYETALHHVDREIWQEIGNRCRDKKASVRQHAFDALGRIFRLARGELESRDPSAIKQFGWIPSCVLKASFVGGREIDSLVAGTLDRHILRLPASVGDAEDAERWTSRLLLVMSHLEDDRARKALIRHSNLRKVREPFVQFVKACEDYNAGIIDNDEAAIKLRMATSIKKISSLMADPPHATSDLHAFAKANDNRTYRLLRSLLDAQSDLKTLVKVRSELTSRLKDTQPGVTGTMDQLLRMSCLFLVNKSTVPTLLKRLEHSGYSNTESQVAAVHDADETMRTTEAMDARQTEAQACRRDCQFLLREISKACPRLYSTHVPLLLKALNVQGCDALLTESLRALGALAHVEPATVVADRKVVERVLHLVRSGTVLQSKYAARLLAVLGASPSKSKLDKSTISVVDSRTRSIAHASLEQLAEELTRRLGKSVGERLVADLAALGQIVKYASETAADVGDAIVKTVLTGILMKPWGKDKVEDVKGEDQLEAWVEDEEMTADLRAKLLGLDLLMKRCVAFANAEGVTDVAMPVFRLLFATLMEGEPRKLGAPPAAKSRMRLQASLCVLKMARVEALEAFIKREFTELALVIQDPCFQVRQTFLHKLLKYLRFRRLSPRFNAIPFLVAFDPEKENQDMVVNYAQSMYQPMPPELRVKHFDVSFVRFLHLLAHHPDFSRERLDEIVDLGKYIDFWLDSLGTSQNVSLLYYLSTRLKGIRDTESPGHSDNLYCLSELAQLYIKLRANRENWTISSYPGRVNLPSDIFRPLPSREVQKEVYERVFLPDTMVSALTEKYASSGSKVSN